MSYSYLVDPASSHMLVSKIKPCMSKYKPHCFSWFTLTVLREDVQTEAFRGSKSRNKVSVGEPAEGSLKVLALALCG